jgi:hypothetical protein
MKPIRYLSHCVFCFTKDSCSMRFTQHGKPYLVCQVCMSRAFLNRFDALLGPAIVPQLVAPALKLVEEGKLPWFERNIRELKAYVIDNARGGLVEVPKPVLYSSGTKESVG